MECICGEVVGGDKAWFEGYLYEQKKPNRYSCGLRHLLMQVKTCFVTSNSDENYVKLLCFSDQQLFNQKAVLGKKSLSSIEYLIMKMCCVVANQ